MIILAATPIGNLGDASPRLREALATADVIAAEDTRTTRHLLSALGVQTSAQFVALHDHNEDAKSAELVKRAAESTVVVVSDAGMPGISDPGFAIVREAAAAGVAVTVIPGPSAVLAAVALSGFATDRFAFEGFVPRKGRAGFFAALAAERRTLVFFESPHRLGETLAIMRDALGSDRRAAVCRELTKMYEEVRRGTLSELAESFADGARGEIVVVLEGAGDATVTVDSALTEVLARTAAGERLKDACRDVADATGLASRELYQAALAAQR
ncbi:16S rRNA (cytidine1402-2'-O)-methyltransferase [Microbacteriaceae bacterium MWH-Ta3]|nr:16S rRNA (cytidine1402-2'-O)-methyltransferase [Microbacteriaceae bacterium MWH-Ta3]